MKSASEKLPLLVCTIGHSTRTIDEFIDLLKIHQIECLVDVRTIPRSRHNPQFNRFESSPGGDSFPKSLAAKGIDYQYIEALGGLRPTHKDSINQGWHNVSFRGYADYMQEPGFVKGLKRLIDIAKTKRIAIMCAEAVPWRCHRSLIADALTVRDIRVEDIMNEGKRPLHKLTPFAHVEGTMITYPTDLPEPH